MHGFANWKLAAAGLAVAFMASWTAAIAQTTDIDALKEQNRKLETRLSRVENTAAATKLTEGQKQETQTLVAEMLKAAKQEVAGPDWAKNLKFSGDLRLRYEARMFNRGNNNITGSNFNNNWGGITYTSNGTGAWPAGSTPAFYNYADRDTRYKVRDRNVVRFRLRFGFEKTYKDADLGEFKVEFRLASGASNDPTTANQTMGSMSDNGQVAPGFAKRPVWIDLAYATYKPKFLQGLSVTAGKMRNPFFTNDIYWSGDVNPEGIWAKYEVPNLMDGKLVPWFGTGLFLISEQANLWSDSLMYAHELGVSYKVTDDVKLSFAARYMDYQHYDSASNNAYRGNAPGPIPFIGTGAPGYPGVNAAAALNAGLSPTYAYGDNDFGVIDLIFKAQFNVPITGSYKLPIEAWFDWAHNAKDSYNQSQFIAFNQLSGTPTAWAPSYNSGMNSVSVPGVYNRNYVDANDAFAVGIKAGQNKKKGDWSVGYTFAYIEANSMPGMWTEPSFGYTNRKGHVLNACYNLMDDLTIGGIVYITQPVYSPDVSQNVMVDGAQPAAFGIVPVYTDWWAGEDKTVIVRVEMIWKF
ncbi:MAG: putative porin [Planctomycetes bacterium]|nr:putative porin [Planctomycetota bacterium]